MKPRKFVVQEGFQIRMKGKREEVPSGLECAQGGKQGREGSEFSQINYKREGDGKQERERERE